MRRLLAGSALVAVAAGAGCGGDDAGGGSGELSKAEYIERADAICQELYERRDPLQAEAARAAQSGDSDRAAATLANAAEITDSRIAALEELAPPAGDEEEVDEVIVRGKEVASSGDAAAEAVRENDSKALAEASREGQVATARFNKAAIDYGFFVCGRGSAEEIG